MDWWKRRCINMSQYFPKPCKSFGGNVKVELDLSSYAKKLDIKNVTRADTSKSSWNRYWLIKNCSCWFKYAK